jgi:hypothetical protein
MDVCERDHTDDRDGKPAEKRRTALSTGAGHGAFAIRPPRASSFPGCVPPVDRDQRFDVRPELTWSA